VFATETNTFSSIPTSEANFEEIGVLWAEDPIAPTNIMDIMAGRVQQHVEARGGVLLPSLRTFAQPSGSINRSTYEAYRDRMLADLEKSCPVDIAIFGLHGAMVAQGYDDCEGDILERAREIVGPDTVIGAELDLHSHLTEAMTDSADIIISYKEYPHTDALDRLEELLDLTWRAHQGEIKPTMSTWDCRMIRLFPTQDQPVRGFVDDMMAAEGRDGVLSMSFIHGFPWADVEALGSRMLVITDGDPEKGASLAEEFGRRAFEMRERAMEAFSSIDEALDMAPSVKGGPLVLADLADNPGGGAPEDSTFILRRMLERGVTNAAIACIWDPVAVQLCRQAGEGAEFHLRLGGKLGPSSGDPVDLRVRVEQLNRDVVQEFPGTGVPFPLGDTAWVSAEGIDIVLCTQRNQVVSPTALTDSGVDAEAKDIIVVKSSNHFYAHFEPIAGKTLWVDTPGALTPDLTKVPYTKLKRPLWPMVEDPFAE
jgi:microcystin degradation protein MlrC